MGLYNYWHGDVQFQVIYDYLLPEPAAGNTSEEVDITDLLAIGYRTPKTKEGLSDYTDVMPESPLGMALTSLEEIFMGDESYRAKLSSRILASIKG